MTQSVKHSIFFFNFLMKPSLTTLYKTASTPHDTTPIPLPYFFPPTALLIF